MLSQLFDLIIFPIKECLKMLVDDRITAYLGVSVMECIVTGMIALIVIRALVTPAGVGSSIVRTENAVRSGSKSSAPSGSSKGKNDG